MKYRFGGLFIVLTRFDFKVLSKYKNISTKLLEYSSIILVYLCPVT